MRRPKRLSALLSSTVTTAVAAVGLLPLLTGAGGCRHEPAEQLTSHDAGGAATPGLLGLDGALGAQSAQDGGRADVRSFCGDVYAADNARMSTRCLAKDIAIAQGMARAAGTLCTDDMNAAVARARVDFDADAAKHCIQMLQDSPMTRASVYDTLFAHYPCDAVLLGQQAADQPCRFSVECQNGLACEGYAIGVDGTCKKPPAVGEACIAQRFGTILSESAAHLHHPDCAAGAYCEGKACAPLVAPGKACVAPLSCAGGLSCVMSKCVKLSADGGGCFSTSDCVYGDWCDRTSGAARGKCAPKRNTGADCPSPDACKGRCDSVTPGADAGAGKPGRCQDVCSSG